MSFITKFIDNIIKGRIKKLMKDLIQPILDLVKNIIDRYGVRSLLAGGAIYVLYDLTKSETIPGAWGAIAIVAVTIGYFGFRHLETKKEKK